MKKIIEKIVVALAITTIIYGLVFVRKELELSKERIQTIDNLIQENQRVKGENEKLQERLDIYFKHDSIPLEQRIEKEVDSKNEWLEVATISKKVSQIKYTKEFACFDFSRDFKELLQKDGIPSKIDIIKTEKSKDYHAIVSVQIEPQTGKVAYYKTSQLVDQCFKNEDDKKYYCSKGKIETGVDQIEHYRPD